MQSKKTKAWTIKYSLLSISFLLSVISGLVGCQSGMTNIAVSPDSEMGQSISRMDYRAAHGGIKPEDEANYRAKAMEFIRCAQAGDVTQMLSITSLLTHATESDSMRTVYAQQVVPQFQGTIVKWNTKSETCIDEQNHTGLMFTGTARGKKTFSFDVGIYEESGQLVVSKIRKHH